MYIAIQHNTIQIKSDAVVFFGCYFNFNLNVYCNTTQLNTKEKALGCVWVVSLISILIYIAIQHDLILRKMFGFCLSFFEFNPGAFCNTTQHNTKKRCLRCVWVVILISILMYIAIQHNTIQIKSVWVLLALFFVF